MGKIGRRSQMGAWLQDGPTDWLSVVMWLWLWLWYEQSKTQNVVNVGSASVIADAYRPTAIGKDSEGQVSRSVIQYDCFQLMRLRDDGLCKCV
jgi:hypothetical protein